MVDCLSIVKTDKVSHTVDIVETDIVKLVVEIESFDMSSDEFDKDIGSFDGLKPRQADLSYVHALNELHLHEIRVVPNLKRLTWPCDTVRNEKAAENRPSSSASQEGGHFSFVDTQIIDTDRDARRPQVLNRASISTIKNCPSSLAFQEVTHQESEFDLPSPLLGGGAGGICRLRKSLRT
ncbi:hypothetical protein Tco_0757813 [Tanacetum coccineum]